MKDYDAAATKILTDANRTPPKDEFFCQVLRDVSSGLISLEEGSRLLKEHKEKSPILETQP